MYDFHYFSFAIKVVNNDIVDRIQICQTLFIRKMYFGHVTALSQLANDYANFRIRSQRRHKYAVPWMYLQMISIIDQTVALSDHIIQDRQNATSIKSLTCSVYLSKYKYIPNFYLKLITKIQGLIIAYF